MNEKIEKLEKKKGRIEAQIMAKEAREKKEKRKKDTRRKILIGAFIMDQYRKTGKMDRLEKMMDSYLKRDNDRELFNLPVKKSMAPKLEKSPKTL